MIKKIALAFALAFGAMSAPVLVQPAVAQQAAAFTVDSTLGALLGNPAAKAVLETHLGADFVNNPQMAQAASLTLRQLGQYVPTLTEEKLGQINTDLAAVH